MSTSAIVVLRQACDGGTTPKGQVINFNSNIKLNNHGSHTKIVENNGIVIPINWLGQLGLKQAQGLASALKTLLGKYCPVSRIVTKDTGSGQNNDGTSNPLHTISFYANGIDPAQEVNFDIYNGGETADPKIFNTDFLLQDGIGKFSTVICWEAKGMWRHDSGTFQPDSILGLLGNCGKNGEKVANYEQMKDNSPYKGQLIYIFECNDADSSLTLKIYNYDGSKPVADQVTEITNTSAWPANLCPKCEQHDVSEC